MINCLENMKLTTYEEEVIANLDEGREVEIESYNLNLIGKFLTCKTFNKKAAKGTLRKAWGLEDSLQILEVGSNLFQFKFQSEFDMVRILRGGPWTFDNQLLMLTKWQKGMSVANVRLDHASLWVQIWGAPFDMATPQVAIEVGSWLGIVEEVEMRKRSDDLNLFLRVRVSLPITKPLWRGGFIASSDDQRTWVRFKYERLPIFCHFCGLLGHDLRHCASHYAMEKNGGQVEYQYGDWLKALDGRPKSSSTRETNPASSSSDGLGDNLRNALSKQSELGKLMAAGAQQGENPTVTDYGVFGKSVDSDTIPDPQPFANIDDRFNDTNEESDGVKLTITDKENLILKSDGIAAQLLDEGRQTGVRNGPNLLRPKSTWVRINRMEYGSNLHKKPSNPTTLGKRGNMMSEESVTCGDDEVQNFK